MSNRTVIGCTALVCLFLLADVGAQLMTHGEMEEMHHSISAMDAKVAVLESKTPSYIEGWEYDVVVIPDLEWETKAQQLGKDRWEIVTARRASSGDDKFAYECIVKRRLAD